MQPFDAILRGCSVPIYGYLTGGYTGAGISLVDRITFSTSTTAANASKLSTVRYYTGGLSDGISYGYVGGGNSSAPCKIVDVITFSTSAIAANASSDLSVVRYRTAALGDGSTYGYWSGGISGTDVYKITDRIIFSTKVTSANTTSDLSLKRYIATGLSDGGIYGYFIGGLSAATSTPELLVDRIVFSTSVTSANTVSNLSSQRYALMTLSDGAGIYGYYSGGASSTVPYKITDRITFATSIAAAYTTGDLTIAKHSTAGLSDGRTYGYVSGGYTTAKTTTSDRMTFSTGVYEANTTSNVTTARYATGGVSEFKA